MSGIDDAVRLVAGSDNGCVVRRDGTVACWGGHQLRTLGEATDGRSPVPIPSLHGVTELTLGAGIVCAMFETGAPHCWGMNESGETGHGTMVPDKVRIPWEVLSSHEPETARLGPFSSMSCGRNFCCGIHATGGVSCQGEAPLEGERPVRHLYPVAIGLSVSP